MNRNLWKLFWNSKISFGFSTVISFSSYSFCVYPAWIDAKLSLWYHILPQNGEKQLLTILGEYTLAIHAGKVTAYGCGNFHWGCSTHSGRSSVHLTHRCSVHCYCQWAHSMSHSYCRSSCCYTAPWSSCGSRQCIGWSCHKMCTVWSRMSSQSGSSECKCRSLCRHTCRLRPKPGHKAEIVPVVGLYMEWHIGRTTHADALAP